MTDYIVEMMETAGIEINKDSSYVCNSYQNGYCERFNHKCELGRTECSLYDYKKDTYPPFTAEKQLELIKLLSKNRIGKDYKILEIDRDEIDNLYYFSLTNKEDKCQSTYVSNKDFTQALAQLTTELMNAGQLDKEKVKEILQ